MKRKLKTLLLLLVMIITLTFSSEGKSSFNITYDYGAASVKEQQIINSNPSSVFENDTLNLSNPECEGFEFVGWYLEKDYITPVTALTPTSDTVLYAKWYEMSYSIDYVLTADNIPISASDVTNINPHIRTASEEIFLTEPSYISDNYTFEGWYTDKNYTQKIDIITAGTCKNITLYAHWVNSVFNIYYELGDIANSTFTTENPNPNVYTYGTITTILPAITNDPAYSFEGWYTDEFFTKKTDCITAQTSGDITLYAKWKKTVYTVTYVLNNNCNIDINDINNPNESTRTADADFILSNPSTTNKNYIFTGWYTSPDFDNYTKVSKINAGINENVTLYAKWEQAVYNITYNYGNIDIYLCPIVNPNPKQYKYNDEIILAPLSADGFIFNGWCTDAELKNHITSITPHMYGDMTLYADFTEKTYTITYVLADKEVTDKQVANKNSNIRTTSERFYFEDALTINTDYSFGGWYFDAEFKEKANYIKAYTTSNVTVYAKWIKNVSYIPDWGDASVSDQLTASDARLILRHSAGLENFTDLQKRISDLNNDSAVTAEDARLALRLSAQLESIDEIKKEYSLPEIQLIEGEIIFLETKQ